MSTTVETYNSYEQRRDNLSVTSGSEYVAITLVPGQALGGGVFTGLTPEQARQIAQALNEAAESVERHPWRNR